MGEPTHAVGSIIWVKITGGKWWPGEVVSPDSCPEEVTQGLRKQPLAIVKFFHEDYYEIVKSGSHLLPFVCSRKSEFIRKGRELLKLDPNADKFNKDVAEAEKLCGVPSEDVYDFCNSFNDDGPPSPYTNHYGCSAAKKQHTTTYGSAMVSSVGSSPPKTHTAGRRLVGGGGEGDFLRRRHSATDELMETISTDVRIRPQPSPVVTPKWAAYSCDVCGFQTGRIANIIVHGRSHSDALRLWVSSGCGARDRPSALFHSDTTGAKTKKKDANHTSKVQKVKRKLVNDSDSTPAASSPREELSKSKRKQSLPKKAEITNESSVVTVDNARDTPPTPAPKKRGPKPALNEDGTPVVKRRKKKEDDADSIFDKIKKQAVRKMNRGRPRGSGAAGRDGVSTSFLGMAHRRKAGSDGSSDEDEFLISRHVYDEEERDEGGAEASMMEVDAEVKSGDAEKKEGEDETKTEDDKLKGGDIELPANDKATTDSAPSDDATAVVGEPADVSMASEKGAGSSTAEVVEKKTVESKMDTCDVPEKANEVAVSRSPRDATRGRSYGKASRSTAEQQPEDLTSQPEDLTPQREEGLASSQSDEDVEEGERSQKVGGPSEPEEEADDDEDVASASVKIAKSREDSSSPAEDLTTRAEDLTTRPVDLSTLQDEPSSGGLPEDASTLLEVSTSLLLEDSATVLQSSASLLQDSAPLLGGGPSSSSVGSLLLPDSTGHSEDWPATRSSAAKESDKPWPGRSEEEEEEEAWMADDPGEPSPRPSHAAPPSRADEVSTSDVLCVLGLVPVSTEGGGGPSTRSAIGGEEASVPHDGRDTPSSSDALLPAVGTTRRPSFTQQEESAGDSVYRRRNDDRVSQTDDDRVSQTDDDRVSHAEEDRVSHTDDRISQSDDGTSHYDDERISQTDNRISQTSYGAAQPTYHVDYQPAGAEEMSLGDSTDYDVSAAGDFRTSHSEYGASDPDHRVSQTDGIPLPDDHAARQLDCRLPHQQQSAPPVYDLDASSSSVHHSEALAPNTANLLDSCFDAEVLEGAVVPDACAEEEVLPADQTVPEDELTTSTASAVQEMTVSGRNAEVTAGPSVEVDSSVLEEEEEEVVVEDQVPVDQSMVDDGLSGYPAETSGAVEEDGHSVLEEEVIVDEDQSMVVEEECVSQVVECSTALDDCLIVDTGVHAVAPMQAPHEHWSQHVIDENGMVVAAPPDIYEDPPSRHGGRVLGSDHYGGYVYGLHSIAEDEPHIQQQVEEEEVPGDAVEVEVDVVTSHRTDGDALSVAMETADVPVEHYGEYGALVHPSMIGHVGLASSDELLASIPMPPPPPLPPGDEEYPPPPPPPPPPPLCDESGDYEAMDGDEGETETVQYTKLEAMAQQPVDDCEDVPVYLEDVGMLDTEEVHVESEQVMDEMDMFCNEVVIESEDRGQQEYEICLEETVAAEQSLGGTGFGGSGGMMMMGMGGEVAKMAAAEEVGVNGAHSAQGGIGLDNGLSFGHAR